MSWKAVKTVVSKSGSGEKYYIKRETGTKNYSCTCKSWVFSNESPKVCKHINDLKAELTKSKDKSSYYVVKDSSGRLMSVSLYSSPVTAGYLAKLYYGAYVEKVKV